MGTIVSPKKYYSIVVCNPRNSSMWAGLAYGYTGLRMQAVVWSLLHATSQLAKPLSNHHRVQGPGSGVISAPTADSKTRIPLIFGKAPAYLAQRTLKRLQTLQTNSPGTPVAIVKKQATLSEHVKSQRGQCNPI